MENYIESINKECDTCEKISLNGVIHTSYGKKAVIYESDVYESLGNVSFLNCGYCSVEIYKNLDKKPIAVISPGDSFTLSSDPLFRIEIKCRRDECINNSDSMCCNKNTLNCSVGSINNFQYRRCYKNRLNNSDECANNCRSKCCKSNLYYDGFICLVFDCNNCCCICN